LTEVAVAFNLFDVAI